MQYFSRLLDSPIESGLRVMYAESSETEGSGLGLLATHLMDFHIGALFFNNPERMHSDLLAPAAQAFLPELLAGYPDPDAVPPCDPLRGHGISVPAVIAIALGAGAVCFLLGLLVQRRCGGANDGMAGKGAGMGGFGGSSSSNNFRTELQQRFVVAGDL